MCQATSSACGAVELQAPAHSVAHPNQTDPGLHASPGGRFGIIPGFTDCQTRVVNSSSLPISQPGP